MDGIVIKLLRFVCVFCLVIKCYEAAPYLSSLLEDNGQISSRETSDDSVSDASISQRIREEDLRKLILKKLRFRDLEGEGEDELFGIKSNLGKRTEQFNSALAHKVAALLNGLKVRQVKSPNVRMPSLRFG